MDLTKFDILSWNLPGWAEVNHNEICQSSLSRRRDPNWAPAERVRSQKLGQPDQSTCLDKRFIMQYLVHCFDVRMVIKLQMFATVCNYIVRPVDVRYAPLITYRRSCLYYDTWYSDETDIKRNMKKVGV